MKSSVLLVVVIVIFAGLVLFDIYHNYNTSKPQNGKHAYLGAIYKGLEKNTDSISANVSLNGGNNINTIIYYVVLSIWDSNGSYDQLGIASLYGKFYSTYSFTETLKNGSIKYIFSNQWFPIKPGNHTIRMEIYSGNLTFIFDSFSVKEFTGGNYFDQATNKELNGTKYSDLTVYEEIYGLNESFPGFSFNFSDIRGGNGNNTSTISNWGFFGHNVSANYSSLVYINGSVVNIYNSFPLTLHGTVNVKSTMYLRVADLFIRLSNIQEYSISLMKGNYTVILEYQNGSVFRENNISLQEDMWYNITYL